MKKAIAVLVMGFLLSSCSVPADTVVLPEPVPYQKLGDHSEGITMTLEEDTFYTQPEYMNISLVNRGSESYHYGTFYQLEYKSDGFWHIVPYRDNVFAKYPDFKNTGRMMLPDHGADQVYSPKKLDLRLFSGEYRLVKTFVHSDFNYTVTVAVPFKITDRQIEK
ncbi:immunoglobulin-like domain-containing protein [Salinicoccus halodurans]|uniref:Bacterial Ig-like domain-containing protein n=1 Tax=Salinicoccus halodurans TaxID=407035 RepID=A0A0F7HLL0_9STAP|nr:immunoglobulin-like domain-containing protein [Salinicoccus halodurans]AKG73998.1 hypothetical protein AAT16_06985 [Salinicoccus halodurans]SFK58991.1 hypothetical protein SAMN05216235_0641 [Salinicoccus halodurans]